MQLRFSLASFILIAYSVVAANATDSPSSSCPVSTVTETVTFFPTSTPTPACPPFADTIPLRRMWNAQLTVHFYSTYGPEVAQFGTQGFVEEAPQGRVYPTQFDGTAPLFRCVDAANTPEVDYFYTANIAEWQAKIASGCQEMPDPAAAGVSQGIGYLYTSSVCGAVPLYRLFSSSWGDYFYTINETERQGLLSSGLYADQGITGYVIPN